MMVMVSLLVVLCAVAGHSLAMDTLYPWTDPVYQLHADNFTQLVTGSDTAWVVEFYAIWCGHCQRFSPTWQRFYKDISDWQGAIKVGAIPCSDPANNVMCSQVGIKGYPTVKFFNPYTSDVSISEDADQYMAKQTTSELRHATITFLETIKPVPSNGDLPWPNIAPVRSLKAFLKSARNDAATIYMLIEDENDGYADKYMLREVVLDLSMYAALNVAWMHRNVAEVYGIPARSFPALFHVDADGTFQPVEFRRAGRRSIRNAILTHSGVGLPDEKIQPEVTQEPFLTTIAPVVAEGLHMKDLQTALYYSLWLEIGGQPSLEGPALTAAKQFVKAMAQFFPGTEEHRTFLRNLDNELSQVTGPIVGEGFHQLIESAQGPGSYFPQKMEYAECQGSQPRFRGYPCTLWMTFHSLTVNAFIQLKTDPSFMPEAMPVVIREYVRYFLGCRDCAEHFLGMTEGLEAKVSEPEDGILFLWNAHNSANARLHGDVTEDPGHPKIQWPSPQSCTTCRNGAGKWDEDEMVKYLTHFYSAANVIQDA